MVVVLAVGMLAGGSANAYANGRRARAATAAKRALAGLKEGARDLVAIDPAAVKGLLPFPGLVRTMAWGTAGTLAAAAGASPDQWPLVHPLGSFFIEVGQHLPSLLPPPDFPEHHVGEAFMTGVGLRALKNLVVGAVRGPRP